MIALHQIEAVSEAGERRGLTQAEERQDSDYDDDESYDINDPVHTVPFDGCREPVELLMLLRGANGTRAALPGASYRRCVNQKVASAARMIPAANPGQGLSRR